MIAGTRSARPSIEDAGETATIQVNAENRLARLEESWRPSLRRPSSIPGRLFRAPRGAPNRFDLVIALASHEVEAIDDVLLNDAVIHPAEIFHQ